MATVTANVTYADVPPGTYVLASSLIDASGTPVSQGTASVTVPQASSLDGYPCTPYPSCDM